MKKMVVLMFMVLFLASCGQHFSKSEFLQHETMYKNWDHMKFSWFGPDWATSQDLNPLNRNGGGSEVPTFPVSKVANCFCDWIVSKFIENSSRQGFHSSHYRLFLCYAPQVVSIKHPVAHQRIPAK